ncbi:circadian clock-controlled protein daywake-like [Periplaneta americana]|uniref:circadian clock-controlled protein daywake-like n=1 Tax=Periplaneta americana TaxID=6978 RepID=UPI0037E9B7D6
MENLIPVLVYVVAVSSAEALKLPPYITACSVKDPDLNSCVLKQAKVALPELIKGDPKYKFPVLDPMIVEKLVIKGALNIEAEDLVVKGIRNTTLKSIDFDLKKKTMVMELIGPEVHFEGKYRVEGKLASLPMNGKGTLEVSLYDLYVKYTTHYELKTMKDGLKYLDFKDYEVECEPKGVKSQLNNLFNGNKVLGDAMNDFINNNWRDVLKEIGPSLYDALAGVAHKIFQDTFMTVPYKDIFMDTE